MKVSISAIFPRYYYLEFLAVLIIFRVRTTDAFSTHHPTAVSDASRRMKLSSGNSLSSLILEQDNRQCQQQIVGLSAVNNNMNNQNQPIADLSYDFIATEEADKMLQQERLRNEQEIREMKTVLKRQHQELLEFDSLASHIQLSNQEVANVVDLEFAGLEDSKSSKDVKNKNPNNDESIFSSFSTTIDEEQYRQHHRHSHNTAECRTLEISIRQIDEENEDLKDEFNDQQDRYESDIEKRRSIVCDLRDRFDCVQHELKIEMSYSETAKAELEELLDQERSKVRELEQQLLIARREQEILEQAAVEAQYRQQDLQEHQHQQRLIQLEQEEQERQQQQSQQEQDHVYHEELLRNHQELVELEKYQKQFDDVYFNIYDDNSVDKSANDNLAPNPNQSQLEQDVVAVNGGQGPRQYQNPIDSAQSTHSPQSTRSGQYDMAQQQHQQQHQTFNVAVTTQITDPRQSKRETKRDSRTNSYAHGMFMNFNDILV